MSTSRLVACSGVILGILAATALPRFINVTTDARTSAVQGIAGGLRSAVAVVQARYYATGTNTSRARPDDRKYTLDNLGNLVVKAGRGEFGLHRVQTGGPWGQVARITPAARSMSPTSSAMWLIPTSCARPILRPPVRSRFDQANASVPVRARRIGRGITPCTRARQS